MFLRLFFFFSLVFIAIAPRGFAAGVIRVRNVPALQHLNPTPGSVASVSGYWEPGDGGGGLFEWSDSDTTPPDGGVRITSKLIQTGCWVRRLRSGLNPIMFGARRLPDVDDAPAMRNAFAAYAQHPVANFHLPPGTYVLSSTVTEAHVLGSTVIIPFFHEGMTGRKLILTGHGARLFSTISPHAAPILFVKAAFRSLRIGGITFEKTQRPLFSAEASAEGLNLTAFDRRQVDEVRLIGCSFVNCHRAFSIGLYLGSNLWGKVRKLEVRKCNILYPYGANGMDGQNAYTGFQMTHGGPWIEEMIYRDCLFDGASLGYLEETTCPGFRLLDGSHFGGPKNLIFERNVVRHFSVEGFFQIFEYVLDGTILPFIVPAPGESVTVKLTGRDSSYATGMRLRLVPGGLYDVVEHRPETSELVLLNTGASENIPAGESIGGTVLYDAFQKPSNISVVGNVFDGTPPPTSRPVPIVRGRYSPGAVAIATHGINSLIERNRIVNCYTGVALYKNEVASLTTPSDRPHSIVRNNQIAPYPHEEASHGSSVGVYIEADHSFVANNRIRTDVGASFLGLYFNRSNASAAVLNSIVSLSPVRQNAHDSSAFGVMIAPGSPSPALLANTTTRMNAAFASYFGQQARAIVGKHVSIEDEKTEVGVTLDPLPAFLEQSLRTLTRKKLSRGQRPLPNW